MGGPAGAAKRRSLGRSPDGRYLTEVDAKAIQVSEQPDGTPPTPADRRAARSFRDATFAAIAKYRDLKVAVADGYTKIDAYHYVKRAYLDDGRVADPLRIESLLYFTIGGRDMLLGAMYLAPDTSHGPQVAGPLTPWHYHAYEPPACVVSSGFPVGLPDRNGRCAQGNEEPRSPEMLHVWYVNPGGTFSEQIYVPTPAEIRADARLGA